MIKVDVAIQSFNKPESLIYTLLSIKKYCGSHIDTIYIDDDQSDNGVVEHYQNPTLVSLMNPIKIVVRTNAQKSGYTTTLMTKKAFKRKSFLNKLQLFGHFFIRRIRFLKDNNDIRYQWGINSTNKKYIFLIHDDIKFFDDVLGRYINEIEKNANIAIVGDLGGSKRCEFGPCFEKNCCPKKIIEGFRPCEKWPVTAKSKSFLHKMLGRKNRHCRINEWCCLIDVLKARTIEEKYGVFFGNYEGGGDVGTYWFDVAINKEGYSFADPLPTKKERLEYYLHWWQGYEGHAVWVDGSTKYCREMVIEKLWSDFGYKF